MTWVDVAEFTGRGARRVWEGLSVSAVRARARGFDFGLEQAAQDLGASPMRTFWKITFPLLKPGHFFVLVVSVIGCLKVFDQMYIVSGGTGGPNYSTLTVVLYMYQTAISDLRWGYAAAIGVVLFLIIFVFTLVQRLLFGRAEVS